MHQSTDFLTGLLDESWKRYSKALKRARNVMDEDAIHDLRLATRRLQTPFGFLSLFLPAAQTRKANRNIRSLRKSLGPLRDTQVQIAMTAELANDYPDLLKFQKHLGRLERAAIGKVAARLRDSPLKLERNFSRALADGRDLLSMFTAAEIERTIVGSIDRTYLLVIERQQNVARQDTSAIHDLRVALKEFRYAIEAARPILPEIPDTQLARMRYFQQLMGDIHDVELLYAVMSAWGRRHKKKRKALSPVYAFLAEKRRSSIETLFEGLHEIQEFWKPGRTQRKPASAPVRQVNVATASKTPKAEPAASAEGTRSPKH